MNKLEHLRVSEELLLDLLGVWKGSKILSVVIVPNKKPSPVEPRRACIDFKIEMPQ